MPDLFSTRMWSTQKACHNRVAVPEMSPFYARLFKPKLQMSLLVALMSKLRKTTPEPCQHSSLLAILISAESKNGQCECQNLR